MTKRTDPILKKWNRKYTPRPIKIDDEWEKVKKLVKLLSEGFDD